MYLMNKYIIQSFLDDVSFASLSYTICIFFKVNVNFNVFGNICIFMYTNKTKTSCTLARGE